MKTEKTRVLITGGAGFIGHHLVEHILRNTDWDIVILDKLTYASSGFDRLKDIEVMGDSRYAKRVMMLTYDFTKPIIECLKNEIGQVDYIFHLAAETHVDNSITDPGRFVESNIIGTFNMLEYARSLVTSDVRELKLFLYFSTDEVFGPAPKGVLYKEGDRHNPGNPYAASKAAAEDLCVAYANTYKIPIVITNTMNAFGERQHQEKFIPKVINSILKNRVVKIHSDKSKKHAGTRFYIHCRNIAAAVLFIINNYKGEVLDIHDPSKGRFNIVGEKEVNNLEMAKMIAKIIGKKLRYIMVDFHSSRPGHDLRYSLDGSKMKKMGWSIPASFKGSLMKTVLWTLNNKKWLNL